MGDSLQELMAQTAAKYRDIIDLPHHVSTKHKQMTLENRAAQFSPFAALTGYEAAIAETARLTDDMTNLDENVGDLLDSRLQILQQNEKQHPLITVTYFVPDNKKEGGAYELLEGWVKKLDLYEKTICFQDGRKVTIDKIISLEGDLFRTLEDENRGF